jgi:hypothetical protein
MGFLINQFLINKHYHHPKLKKIRNHTAYWARDGNGALFLRRYGVKKSGSVQPGIGEALILFKLYVNAYCLNDMTLLLIYNS